MVTYVTDTSHWEAWQRDYRFGLILILPPPEVARQIDPLKARYDLRGGYVCDPHRSRILFAVRCPRSWMISVNVTLA